MKVEPINHGRCDGDPMCIRLAMYRISIPHRNIIINVCDKYVNTMNSLLESQAQAVINSDRVSLLKECADDAIKEKDEVVAESSGLEKENESLKNDIKALENRCNDYKEKGKAISEIVAKF